MNRNNPDDAKLAKVQSKEAGKKGGAPAHSEQKSTAPPSKAQAKKSNNSSFFGFSYSKPQVVEQQVPIDPGCVWQYQYVFFDLPAQHIKLRKGELLLDSLASVEDLKGGTLSKGTLMVTNLRAIFIEVKRGSNISVGWGCVSDAEVKGVKVQEGKGQEGQSRSSPILVVNAKTKDFKGYSFAFMAPNNQLPKIFMNFKKLVQVYQASKLYREVKLRFPHLIDNGELLLLGSDSSSQAEKIGETIQGVFNLTGSGRSSSTSGGMIGTMYLTNVRVVWHAAHSVDFNLSIPFNQMKQEGIKTRDTKFGLVLSIMVKSGESFGFRIDPKERLDAAISHMVALHRTYLSSPLFGVYLPKPTSSITKNGSTNPSATSSSTFGSKGKGLGNSNLLTSGIVSKESSEEISNAKSMMDGLVVLEKSPGVGMDPSAYFADPLKERDRPLTFDPHLGLAVEECVGTYEPQTLWLAMYD